MSRIPSIEELNKIWEPHKLDISSLNPYGAYDADTTRAIWEPRKEYIEKDLWVIKNFLSEEEVAWLEDLAKTTKDWYTTMRSPYGGNTKNHFIGFKPKYTNEGVMILDGMGNPEQRFRTKYQEWEIDSRIAPLVPESFAGAGAFQSFFEIPDEQIIIELGHDVDYAMDFHYEQDPDEEGSSRPVAASAKAEDNIQTAAISLYINTDYDGGILEFKNKTYSIKPEAGMLVNIPLYKEFEHRVTKVTNGNRHTLYGRSFTDLAKRHHSTNEDC